MTVRLAPPAAIRRRLVEVARGAAEADLVITGGALLDVFTEAVVEGWGLAVAGSRVAFAGPDAEVARRAGPATGKVELDGDLLAPGLIEGHTHIARVGLADFAELQLRAGVTTSVVETMELGAVAGPEGVREMLVNAARMPGRLLFTISALLQTDPDRDAEISGRAWTPLLDHPLVAGLGEVYWADALRGHPRVEELITACLERGMPVDGHGAGARPAALNALAGLGVGSDHEGISGDDVLARLRLGLWTMARHGATRQDLPAIAAVWTGDRPPGLGRLILVTDGTEPEPLGAGESLNRVVEQAVELGLSPARAVRLASLNVAERFGLGRWLGGLGPGMLADLVVLPRRPALRFRPRLVLVGGGRPGPAPAAGWPAWMLETVRTVGLGPELLRHPGPGRWRAMELQGPLVTREVESDGRRDLVCTVVDRVAGARGFRGLLRGFGLKGGGAAISSGWESGGLLIVGDRPGDMAAAARRVGDLRGGAAVVSRDRVLAEWAAPVAGLYSTASWPEVAEQIGAVNRALQGLGCAMPNPALSLEALTTAAIPFLRIWPGGYRRLRDGACLGLEWAD